MTETFCNTSTYQVDHSTFGGLIYLSDFETDYRGNDSNNGSSIASRIACDWKFDNQCKKNREIIDDYKNWRY